MTTEASEANTGIERTWRPSGWSRGALMLSQALLVAPPALFLWLTLWSNQVQAAGWVALAVAVVVWGWLAGRTLAVSATLTQDTLKIRNVLTTVDLPLTEVTGLHFRRDILRVLHAPHRIADEPGGDDPGKHASHPAIGVWYPVSAIRVSGADSWTGRRASADNSADAIAAAAGLPPLPPRRQRISLRTALLITAAGPACGAAGAILVATSPAPAHFSGNLAGHELEMAAVWLTVAGTGTAVSHLKNRRAPRLPNRPDAMRSEPSYPDPPRY